MIPYNPSSFDTNKTILEQILELKKWLKEHPSYAVYTTYIHYKPAENVDYFFREINGDPDFVDNIAVGDLLWFGDGYISPIASITIDPNDRENSYVTISQPVTSLIGPTGPQGPRGYDGVSVTNASVNASGYLIITLSNGLTVNTGYVVGPQGTTGPEGPEGPQGPTGPTGVSITNVAIDGNSHLIVTLSDGSSIDAGSVSSGGIESVSLSIGNGTLTDSDYNKLLTDGAIIIGSNNRIYEKAEEDSLSIIFKCILFPWTTDNRWGVFTITKSTKEYTHSWQTFTYKSGTATNGQVLTANGNGGASWQNAGGGSGVEVVAITSDSGTLSESDYNKLNDNNALLKRSNEYYRKYKDDGTTLYYGKLLSGVENISSVYVFTITKSTRAYSRTLQNHKIAGIYVLSTGATNGQVLTANGNGGASWQNAGGSGKYLHNIYIKKVSGNINARYFMQYVCDTSTAFSGAFQFATKVYNDGFTTESNAIVCNGNEYDGTKVWFPEAFCCEANNVIDVFHNDGKGSTGATQVTTGSVTTFNDKVIAL